MPDYYLRKEIETLQVIDCCCYVLKIVIPIIIGIVIGKLL